MMRHKIDTAVFAQGWLQGQIEEVMRLTAEKANEDPTEHLIATKMQEQWVILSETMDDLIKENAELNRKLFSVKVAIG